MARAFATAHIEILPDFSRFRSTVQSQISGAVRTVGAASSREAAREAENIANAASRSLANVSRSMITLGNSMSTVGSNMTRSITVPVAAAGVAIFNTGRQFESSMQKIVGLVGVSQSQVNIWSAQLLKMGPAVRRPVTELADALYFATSSGIGLSKAMSVVEISGRAATAGLGTTSVIADTLTSAMNAYAKSGLTAAQAGDILVSAVRDGKVEAEAFAPVLGRLLPTASNLGISFSDMAGTLAVMSRTGLDASEAATSLNAIMTAFLKPAEQSKKALASIGLSAGEVREILSKPGGLVTAMHLLNNRTQGNDEVLARIVPNVRAYRGVMNVLAQDIPGVSQVLDNARNSTGMLDTAFNAMANTAEGRYQQAMSQVQASMIVLSHSVMPLVAAAFARIAAVIALLVNGFSGLSSGAQHFVGISVLILAAIGPTLVVFGKLISSVGQLARAYIEVKKAIIAFNAMSTISAGWIGLIVVAIAALVASLIYAYKHSETFRNIVNAAWASILAVSRATIDWFTTTALPVMVSFFRTVGQWTTWWWQNVTVPAWNGIIAVSRATISWYSSNVLPVLVNVFRGIGTVLTWLWQNIFVPAWNQMLAIVRVSVTAIGVIVLGLIAVFRTVATTVTWLWRNVTVPAFQGIGAVISFSVLAIRAYLVILEFAIRAVATVISWLWRNVTIPAFNGIVAVANVLRAALNAVFNGIAAVLRVTVAPVVTWLWRSIFQPAFTGIQIVVTASINVVRAVLGAIALVIRSVASVVVWLLNNIFRPAFNGIVVVANALYATLRNVFNAIAAAIRVTVAPVVTWLWRSIFQPAFQGIGVIVQIAVRLVQVLFGTMQIAIRALALVVTWLWNNVFTHAFNGIAAIARALFAVLRSVFDSIILVIRNFLAPVVTWLWRNVFVPVMNGIVATTRAAWAVLRSIFDAIIIVLRSYVAPVVTWFWRSIFVPAMNGIGNTARSIWNNFIRPAFILIGTFLSSYVVPAFQAGVRAIGGAWNNLVNVAKTPVRFLVNTIINGAIIDNYKRLAGFFGVDHSKVTRVNLPRGFSRGGPVWGPGTETSDSVPSMLSPNEYVVKAKSARRIGYSTLDYMNTYGDIPRFQFGGRVAATKAWLPSVDPLPYVWGGVGPRGYDCSGLTGEVYARLSGLPSYRRYFTTASNFRALGFSPGTGTYTIGLSASHMAGALAGLNFEAKGTSSGIFVGPGARSPMTFPKQYFLQRAGGQGLVIGDSGGSWFDFLTGPLRQAWDTVSGATRHLTNAVFNNPFGKVVAGAGKHFIDAVVSKITKLGSAFDIGNIGAGVSPAIAAGRTSAINFARILAAQRGWTGATFTNLIRLWDRESGWNYRADNPTSSAYGIPQALPGSKMASAGSDWLTNPATQIKWGLQYIAERYGNPSAAWAHSQLYNWYHHGGRVQSFDNGGVLPPGLSLAYNGTNKPESVVAGDSVASMSRAQFVSAMTEAVIAALNNSGPFVEITPDVNASILDGLVTYRVNQGLSRAAYGAKTGRR
jgi:TP901 family phage tail tape measure protein